MEAEFIIVFSLKFPVLATSVYTLLKYIPYIYYLIYIKKKLSQSLGFNQF